MIALAASSSSTSVFDQPGTLGFLVVFGMAVIMYFLFRSMTKHLRKVNAEAKAEAAKAALVQTEAGGQAHGQPAGNVTPPAN